MPSTKRKQDDSKSKDHKKAKLSSSKPSKHEKKPVPRNLVEESESDDSDDDVSSIEDDEMPDVAEDVEEHDALDMDEMDVAEEEEDANTHPERTALVASTKSREAHAAQKKLVLERKLAKPNADILQRSKKIWETLRRKSHVPLEQRKALTDELFKLITGRVHELVFKHDASRVVQTAVKYGSAQRRQDIAKELKGGYLELAQSSYGKYLVVKLMHYGTPETKKMIVDELLGNTRKLIKHKEACLVVDDAYRLFATKEQKAQFIREWYGAEFVLFKDTKKDASLKAIIEEKPEKRAVIMKSLFDLIKQVMDKKQFYLQILHRAMLEYITNAKPGSEEVTEFLELVKDDIAEIAFSKDGSQVAMRCLAWGTAKDRKGLVKALKARASDLYGDEHGHMVLCAMFDVVDDTVLVAKSIFPEIQGENNLLDAATHKFARVPLLYPIIGRSGRLMPPDRIKQLEEIDRIRETTSKKDPAVRQGELRKTLSPILLKLAAESADVLVLDPFGQKFLTEVLLFADGDKIEGLRAVAETAVLPTITEKKAVETFISQCRIYKNLVQGGLFNQKEKRIIPCDPPLDFHQYLIPKIQPKLLAWAMGEGAFVVRSLLESDRVSKDEKATLKNELTNDKATKELKAKKDGNKAISGLMDLLK